MGTLSSAQARFLTFAEATLLERSVTTLLQQLERQGQGESAEAIQARQLLRDFVYFTSSDTLSDLTAYLQGQGWVTAMVEDLQYEVMFAPEGQTFASGERMALLLPTWIQAQEAEEMIMRAMAFLSMLADPENVCPYDLLLRMRASGRERRT